MLRFPPHFISLVSHFWREVLLAESGSACQVLICTCGFPQQKLPGGLFSVLLDLFLQLILLHDSPSSGVSIDEHPWVLSALSVNKSCLLCPLTPGALSSQLQEAGVRHCNATEGTLGWWQRGVGA